MTEERFKEILDAFLGDADLMVAVNGAPTFEAGYELVAEKMPGLSIDEFKEAMDILRQVAMMGAEKTPVC